MRPHRCATATTAAVSGVGATAAAISRATAPARSLRGVMPLPAA
jgi:hypothetical protein